ncbi:hypothetical protein BRD56_05385 [Thermoplasmatales archaeon SW_10_69_26]|nr:MAG: hypothetical protein BRD56_05385 [Thermoplasmatales archaeon SW_10_69_26]
MPARPAQKRVKRVRPNSKDVTLDEGDDGQRRLTVPISSTEEDRDGDLVTLTALESMRDQIEADRVPLFLDHGLDDTGAMRYRVEDMIGAWEEARIETDPGTGESTLIATAVLEEDNPDADMLWTKLENGLPVGFSIGYFVLESEQRDPEETRVEQPFDPLVIDDVDLVETSPVGIPSNPASVAGVDVEDALRTAAAGTSHSPRELKQALAGALTTVLTQDNVEDNMTTDPDDADEPSDETETGDGPDADEGEGEPATGDVDLDELADAIAERVAPDLVDAVESAFPTDEDDEDEDDDEETESSDPEGEEPEEGEGEGERDAPRGDPREKESPGPRGMKTHPDRDPEQDEGSGEGSQTDSSGGSPVGGPRIPAIDGGS